MRLQGIVFDLDGTLVQQELDFEAMRREIGVPLGTPLLETLAALPEPERARAWGLAPAEIMMVGDYLYDLQAGRNAGTRTALVTHGKVWEFAHLADWSFPNLCDLSELI